MKISYGKCVQTNKDLAAVVKALKEGTQMNKNTKKFEKKISSLFKKKFGLMTNSGSSALLLAYETLSIKKGSNFITPVLNFSTTVSMMIKSGYIPNFVDINPKTFCIDENKIEKSINKKTAALVIPNLIGVIPNYKKIKFLAKKYNLLIIEDSADTLGALYNKKSTGNYSDISITSFYGSHIITCAGNGGFVGFNNKKSFLKAKLLRSWGRRSSLYDGKSESIKNRFGTKISNIPYDKKFIFDEIGYNLEPSEIGCAYGLEQFKRLKKNISIRKKNFIFHNLYFKKKPDYFQTPELDKNSDSALLAYPLTIKPNKYFNRNDLQIFLEKNHIQTRPVFTGNIIKQPGFKKIKCIKDKKYENADFVMKNSMLIGCHHGLRLKEINYIHKIINKFLVSKLP
tara:strand:+ start:6866 stop:8059 length:1194 start_codon:yes stop_codon:yes gene_type:complete